MSQETQLFSAPKSYPEPPKNMWYKVPEIKPQMYEVPKPIFPWEMASAGSSRAAPTRVFAEDYPPEPEPEPKPESQAEDEGQGSSAAEPDVVSRPTIEELVTPSSDPWGSFTRTNAWDDDASIERYVRALKKSQFRGQVQVLHNTSQTPPAGDSGSTTPTRGRRESFLLTDFPSEIERPSLPVTPAPRRTSFWGNEKESSGEPEKQLVAAEGVPEQNDWVCPNCGCKCPLPELSAFPSKTSAAVVSSFEAEIPLPSKKKTQSVLSLVLCLLFLLFLLYINERS